MAKSQRISRRFKRGFNRKCKHGWQLGAKMWSEVQEDKAIYTCNHFRKTSSDILKNLQALNRLNKAYPKKNSGLKKKQILN